MGCREERDPVGIHGPRYSGMDALRAATMVMVVALHAALAYAPTPIPHLIWACRDPDASPVMDVFCWWSLGISSPFFLMSGFFAADLHAARGGRAFLIGRAKRIGVPLLAAALTILPATFYVWVAGWLASGACTPREVGRMRFHAKGFQENLYGPAHLWSLEYLAIVLLGFWAWREIASRIRGGRSWGSRWWGRGLSSAWRPIWPAVPTALILWAGRRHIGLDAILDRTNAFAPEPYRFLHNVVFFAVGVSLFQARHCLKTLAPWGPIYLVLTVPVFAARAWLIREDLASPLDGLDAAALAATGSLFCWLLTFGLLGVSLGPTFDRNRPSVRYLADASYWLYLVHLPIVGLVQIALLGVSAAATIKFAVVLIATLGLGLATYEAFVRYTFLGAWLHGRRERRHAAPLARPSCPVVPAGRPHILSLRQETAR
jgi:glucans biosynthesis protein C